MDDAEIRDLADFASALGDLARRETLTRAGGGEPVIDKSGGGAFDPVTEADRAAETALRRAIEARYPEHGISGEEFPDRPPTGRYGWSLDPIDGTGSFICGLPTWTTLIALLDGAAPLIGLIDAPRLDERYLGYAGQATLNGTPIAVSFCRALAEARLSTTDPYLLEGTDRDGFERLRRAARTTRYGHDAYAYARLAAGSIDLIVEAGLKPHDLNALIPVVRGAGGVIGDWLGNDDCAGGRLVAAASWELYDEAVAILNA